MFQTNRILALCLICVAVAMPTKQTQAAESGPVRVLFLGHEATHHRSNDYFPMLARALGRDAIYFDYVTSVEQALGDANYLNKFDALLLYANHGTITKTQWTNLKTFVGTGGGFLPIHCASWCFANEPDFDKLVGGRFAHHKGAIFRPKTVSTHPAVKDVPLLEAWDETYVHKNHNESQRTVLQVREVAGADDNIKEPEPWTWIRHHGKGRVFYTASGHDQRVWSQPAFHALIKKGILWSIGDQRKRSYDQFIADRQPLEYERRGNIPNYEKRPEPLPYQLPLSPEASLQYTRVPVGFRLELFAAEPQIVNPIYIQWDERGRLWVAESRDYPNEIKECRKGNDSIKILEDIDGDGRCDTVKVFADGLNIPTSFTFSQGGIIVAHAPDFLFLKDTDGDDRADVKKVLFSGWGYGDTHAGPGNLRYGFDNWIYGTVGYARFKGELGGKNHNFGMGVFRFKPDASDIEFLHQFNNNTWGLGFNTSGEVFGSTANNNPSFFGGLPQTIYGTKRRMSAKMIASSPTFHPITPNIRQVDVFNGYTAGCGHALATSTAFPKDWHDEMAFVCGPTGNLMGGYRMQKKGSGYAGKNSFAIVASADEWFSPITAEVGPDGHLWISDWYNFIIQHNPTPNPDRGGYKAERGIGNAHVNPNRDRQHGRIYRLIWDQASKPGTTNLADASTKQLVAALSDGNMFWRQTAQRLLVDGQRRDAIPMLKNLVRYHGHGTIHALWALKGLNALDADTHRAALFARDLPLKQNAVRALGTDKQSIDLLFDSTHLTANNLHLRREAIAKLASLPDEATRTKTANLLLRNEQNQKDEWLSLALKAAGGSIDDVLGYEPGPNLVKNGSFENGNGDLPNNWRIRKWSGPKEGASYDIETRRRFVKSGRRSMRISSTVGHDTCVSQQVPVKPDTEYRLTGWVKSDSIKGARGVQYNLHALQPDGRTEAITGTRDWTRVQTRFRTKPGQKTVLLNTLFGGWGRAKGTAWFDDVHINEMVPIIGRKEADEIVGNPKNGEKIFRTHQVAACIRCHALNGEGGIVGPPTDGIGLRKDREYILESLINPTAKLAEGYEKLVNTPMPPMNIVLDDQEIADVLEFLVTLKKPGKPVKPKAAKSGKFE
ncbi:MAG: glycosyl hydrolase [Verrucomicrobiales bacterium]|nr:glycosyl hydrolase [Verrucomicrobiales bacterium]